MVINELGWVADGWDDSQSGRRARGAYPSSPSHRRAASCDVTAACSAVSATRAGVS